jgi:hypothetical protein
MGKEEAFQILMEKRGLHIVALVSSLLPERLINGDIEQQKKWFDKYQTLIESFTDGFSIIDIIMQKGVPIYTVESELKFDGRTYFPVVESKESLLPISFELPRKTDVLMN